MSRTPHLDLRSADGTRLTFRLPMLGTEALRALTGLTEDDILAEVDSGKLLWAWNLASAGAERIFLRVWNRSALCWLDPSLSQPDQLDQVVPYLLPHSRPTLRCVELKRVFNCDSEHVLHLLEDGLLTRVPGAEIVGRQSPVVTRQSVVSLLDSRRLP